MQPMIQPTVGRIVHYTSHGSPVLPDGTQIYKSVCRAAIVTGDHVFDSEAGDFMTPLAVLNPEGMFFQACPADESRTYGGTWHWPEQVTL